MNIKKILFGSTPDKDDPKYQKLREDFEAVGRRVTELSRIGKFVSKIQKFAETHQKVFFSLLFFYVVVALIWSVQRVNFLWHNRPVQSSAVERQEQELHLKRHHAPGGSDQSNHINNIYYYHE